MNAGMIKPVKILIFIVLAVGLAYTRQQSRFALDAVILFVAFLGIDCLGFEDGRRVGRTETKVE